MLAIKDRNYKNSDKELSNIVYEVIEKLKSLKDVFNK